MHRKGQWLVGLVGSCAIVIATVVNAKLTAASAAQDWPPFVLVVGLLLVGFVADREGLFRYTGGLIARLPGGGSLLFVSSGLLVVIVTAFLNLDTSVTFLTPVLVYAARRRLVGVNALLYGCLFLSNAASLILPGANLTNLIVLGHLHLAGGDFVRRMALPTFAAVLITGSIVAIIERRSLHSTTHSYDSIPTPTWGIGVASSIAVAVVVLTDRSPAIPVLSIGVLATGIYLLRSHREIGSISEHLGLELIVGLFGIAATLGAIGRAWPGPSTLINHGGPWLTAGVATATSVVVNNLPAASLFAARNAVHPYALVVGLDVGPNLFATGALSWILWFRSARTAGETPNLVRATLIGVFAAPIAICAAVAVLQGTGVS